MIRSRLLPAGAVPRILSVVTMPVWIPVVVLAVILAPPAEGEMLLVPLTEEGSRSLVAALGDRSTRLIAAGPIPGSLVLRGPRGSIWGRVGGKGVLLLGVPDMGCSA